jgi:hypothetical protein
VNLGTRTNLVVVLLTLATMLGCSALNASQPATQQDGTANGNGISLNPKNISFGNVPVGKTHTLTATVSNPGFGTLIVTHAAISGQGFALTGPRLPLVLASKQTASIGVSFTPTSGGNTSGVISLTGTSRIKFSRISRKGHRPVQEPPTDVVSTVPAALKIPVSGIGTLSGQLTASPAVLALGRVRVGASQTQAVTLVNSGGTRVTVKQATVTGRGFRMSGLTFPLTLSPGQKKTFSVTFTPQSSGTSSGSVSVTSNAPNPVVSVPVSGVAIVSGALIANPSSLNFGSVQTGRVQTLSAVLSNQANSSVTVARVSVSGSGFAVSGLSLPTTLAAGQSAAFSVTFTPRSGASAATGALALVTGDPNGGLTIPLFAGTATVGALSTSDSTLDFSNVPVGSTNPLSETLTNTGGSTVTVTQARVSGAAFHVTGLSLPLTLSPGQSFTFGAVFAPTTGGSATGLISVISDASNPTLTISLAGTATVSGQLAVNPAALSFGSVTVGQSKSLPASLTATGSSITITGANMSTSEFTVSGLALPVTLAAGKSVSFTIRFAPQSSGAAAASASFTSNASNSSAQQSLTGSGTAAPQHSVALSWSPSSSSAVVGYNIYRGVTNGGPYSKIDSLNADTTYSDSSVQAGQTYFYVTTAVDGTGRESAHSNQTQAVVPTP